MKKLIISAAFLLITLLSFSQIKITLETSAISEKNFNYFTADGVGYFWLYIPQYGEIRIFNTSLKMDNSYCYLKVASPGVDSIVSISYVNYNFLVQNEFSAIVTYYRSDRGKTSMLYYTKNRTYSFYGNSTMFNQCSNFKLITINGANKLTCLFSDSTGVSGTRGSNFRIYSIGTTTSYTAQTKASSIPKPYPNPCNTSVTIPYELSGKPDLMRILDTNGKEVLSKTVTPDDTKTMIDVSLLSPGTYITVCNGNSSEFIVE